MHELSVASGILDAVEKELTRRGTPVPCRLVVRVGDLSGVDRSSLEFCLSVAGSGTPLEDLPVRVERVAATLTCPDCGKLDAEDGFTLACPRCGSLVSAAEGGRELEVLLETEEEEEDEDRSHEEGP